MADFKDFPLIANIQKALDVLGFSKPTEIQEKIIPALIENPQQDVHAQAQTGTGKTLAFGIPLLHAVDPSVKQVQALIVAPTRELVLQIYESLKEVSRQTGIGIEPVYGGMSMVMQIKKIKQGPQILVGTPGRLIDHLKRKTVSLSGLKTLVLDEADIMLDMGFKEDIDEILTFAPQKRSIWLFSATVLPGIKQLIDSHMHNVLSVTAAKKSVVSSQVKQYFCVVPVRSRIEATARFIEAAPDFYGIIFCQTKVLTTEVMEQLVSRGFRANCLHGDMKQNLRNNVIAGFKKRDFNILIATDVAARGIDVSDLTHVINFSLPNEQEAYIHRIGRTGRAGKEGIAIVLVAPSQIRAVRRLEFIAKTTLQEITVPPIESIVQAKMGAVSDYIEQSKKQTGKVSPVRTALKELVDSFSTEEIKHACLAALETIFFKDINHENLVDVRPTSSAAPQEICVDLGLDGGLTDEDVRDYLHTTCTLLPQEVRKVRVLNKKTFISVSENRLQECIAKMKSEPIANKKYRVYLIEDDYREGAGRSSGERSPRSGGQGRDRRSSGGRGGDRDRRSSSSDRPMRKRSY